MKNDIIKFLGFEDPEIEVLDCQDLNNKRILTLQKKLKRHYCPICSHIMHSKGIYCRTVNHPVMQDGKQLVIKLNQRRWKCTNPTCKNSLNDEFHFVEPYRRNTTVTDLMILNAFRDPQLSAVQISSMYHVSDTYAITLFARYVDMPKRQLTTAICIDEVYIDIDHKSKYAMVIQDFISGEPIDMLPSRRDEITEPYFAAIPLKQRANVKYLVTDMYRPYLSFVDKYFPNAVSVIDSFHVVKMINHHILKYVRSLIRKYRKRDEIRHEELEQKLGRRIDFTTSKEYYLLKKYSWLILKNNEDINYSGKPRFNPKLHRYVDLFEIEQMLWEIDPALKELRDLKEKYIRFNRKHADQYKEAKVHLEYLIEDYSNCPYEMFHDIARSLRMHFDAICNSFIMIERHCMGEIYSKRLSNGPAEALNRIVKDMKRNARGYRNFDHLRNRFLYSQRKNASILGVPKSLDEVSNHTGKIRGPYMKK